MPVSPAKIAFSANYIFHKVMDRHYVSEAENIYVHYSAINLQNIFFSSAS